MLKNWCSLTPENKIAIRGGVTATGRCRCAMPPSKLISWFQDTINRLRAVAPSHRCLEDRLDTLDTVAERCPTR